MVSITILWRRTGRLRHWHILHRQRRRRFWSRRDSISACEAPQGYVEDNTDCDDISSVINPAAMETCDGIDNYYPGDESDALIISTFYQDSDGDGYGDLLKPAVL